MTSPQARQSSRKNADIPWQIMSFYEKFEQVVVIALSAVIAF